MKINNFIQRIPPYFFAISLFFCLWVACADVVHGADYIFEQSTWNGGATGNMAVHSDDQYGWTEYSAKDGNVIASSDVSIDMGTSLHKDTSVLDFSDGSHSNTATYGSYENALVALGMVSGKYMSQIVTNSFSSCALANDGSVYCAGSAGYGFTSTPTRVVAGAAVGADTDGTYLTNVSKISAKGAVTCALTHIGNIYCWGGNTYGELGNGTTTASNAIPVRPLKGVATGADTDGTYLINVRDIKSAYDQVCATTNSGKFYCWGANANGKLGNGTTTASYTPMRPLKGVATGADTDGTYLINVANFDGYVEQMCAVTESGNIYCWGANAYSKLGDGTTTASYTPMRPLKGVATGADTDGTYLINVSLVAANYDGTCAATRAGAMYCWGQGTYGQLGDGTSVAKTTPVRVLKGAAEAADTDGTYLTNIRDIIAINSMACALTASSNLYCWGYNVFGKLGDGTTTNRNAPVHVKRGAALSTDTDGTNLTNVVSISSSSNNFTCASTYSGAGYCWGSNGGGTFGNGTTGTTSTTPVRMTGVFVMSYASSGAYTSGVIDTGMARNYGALNYSRTIVSGTTLAVDVRAGNSIVPDGTWTGWQSGIANNGSIAALNGNRYVQYRINFTTSNASYSPSLNDITFNYVVTPGTFTLTSSVYNTDAVNTSFSHIQWTETIPTNTNILFQMRTSLDGNSWGNWCGPDNGIVGTCDSTSYFTDPSGGEIIDDTQRDHVNDQYVQYKVFLTTTDGVNVPTLSDVSLNYSYTQVSAPAVTTQSVSNIAGITASGNGTVTNTGNENPTRFIEWGTESGIYTNSCAAGTGSTGAFTCDMTGLLPATTYYYRAKATNSAGTAYGSELSFTTIAQPTISTLSATSILARDAVLNASVIATGGENPARSIEYGMANGGPYTQLCSVGVGGVGNYSCAITSLEPNTIYYYRAKAVNSAGTTYGDQVSFATLPLEDIIIPYPNETKVSNAVSDGYLTLNSGNVSNTDKVQTVVNVTFRTDNADAVFPVNTEVTKSDNTPFNFAEFITTNVTSQVRQENTTSVVAVKIGVPNMRLTFSQPITLKLNVGEAYNGTSMSIQYQEDGETTWTDHGSCVITNGQCIFTTTHATTYTVNGSGSVSGAEQNDITTDVQDVLSMDCDQTGNTNDNIVEFGNLTPGTPVTASTTCVVTTNSDAGYSFAVKKNDVDTTMDKDTDAASNIADRAAWDTALQNATVWNVNDVNLGFTVYATSATKNTNWWGTGTTQTDVNNKYAGFPVDFTDIVQHTQYSAIATTINIGYKLDVPTTQKSGTYSGDITYQVITAP